MTLNSGDSGPVAAAHPRIIYPSTAQIAAFSAAAAAGWPIFGTPEMSTIFGGQIVR